MINVSRALQILSLCLATVVSAQTKAGLSTSKPHKTAAFAWHQKAILFTDEKAVLGLPAESGYSVTRCSNDGTIFLDRYADSAGIPDLYSIKESGEVKHLSRLLPMNFTNITMLDFFAGEHELVTLLKGEKVDDDALPSTPHEVEYFLSFSDHDGDGGEVLPLKLSFTPYKVALFGDGDYLILGWDEANLQPLLALLKSDGTVRRFIELSNRRDSKPYVAYDLVQQIESSGRSHIAAGDLQRAQFVPYGSRVLLTYPGTAKSVLVLSAVGDDTVIPVAIPAGFLLHDVLVTSERHPLVLRLQAAEDPAASARGGAIPKSPPLSLFEMNSYHGDLVREFLFSKPDAGAVACAANNRLTAIFSDTIPDQSAPADGTGNHSTPAVSAMQTVIATALH